MSHSAYYSVVLDRSAPEVWDIVRDFNSYPIWVNGVEASHIEDDLPGTTVGAVQLRHRWIAHPAAAAGPLRRPALLHLRELQPA